MIINLTRTRSRPTAINPCTASQQCGCGYRQGHSQRLLHRLPGDHQPGHLRLGRLQLLTQLLDPATRRSLPDLKRSHQRRHDIPPLTTTPARSDNGRLTADDYDSAVCVV
ncbi:hypothetical protein ABZT43_40925 [Streptomyces sp. NPDC005349]|uniref:hypothetical protein n=1 Tax=Streptomyces sp. NPDC005349 TaxID=3157037 RepID=UPI0033AE81BA